MRSECSITGWSSQGVPITIAIASPCLFCTDMTASTVSRTVLLSMYCRDVRSSETGKGSQELGCMSWICICHEEFVCNNVVGGKVPTQSRSSW